LIICCAIGQYCSNFSTKWEYGLLASFNWDKIEGTITSLANTTANTFNDYSIETLGLTNFGIPLTGGMSASFAIGFLKG
jgi:hypothetical protein